MRHEFERIVREAGKLACAKSLASEVHTKGRGDFVTGADLAVSEFLSERLAALQPGSRILSEEGDTDLEPTGKLFIIDPIDGTTNLMYGLGLSALSVAYGENGSVELAAVFNPFTDEFFFAEKGKGATRNGVPIRVNEDSNLSESLIGSEAGPATLQEQEDFFRKLYAVHSAGRGVRITGSAAIDLAYVACGRLSACVFHYLYPWDYGAGLLLLAEAGGMLTDLQGEMPSFRGRSGLLIASNSRLHEAMKTAFSTNS